MTEGDRESVVAKVSSACGEKIVLWWVDFARRKWWKLCVCVVLVTRERESVCVFYARDDI